MQRRTFVRLLAKETKWKTCDFDLALDCIEAYVIGQLKATGKAEIPGLVKFRISTLPAKPERMLRNNLTGQMICVKAKPETKRIRVKTPQIFDEKVFP